MRARWNDLPLRLRLTILYVGLLLVILIALGSFLYLDTRALFISSTASRLQAIAGVSMSHLLPGERPAPLPLFPPSNPQNPVIARNFDPAPFQVAAASLARDLTWQDTIAVVVNRSGTPIADGRDPSDPRPIPVPDARTLARAWAGESPAYVTTIAGQDMLAVLIPVRYPFPDSPIAGVIQMSVPLVVVNQVLQRQQTFIAVGVLAALLLAGAGGLWLTQTALAPLRLMVAVCRRIAGGDLSQRVNLPQRKDEAGQLAAAFDEMVARLDAAFAAQRQFVADASHELRTPLTAIGGSLDVLLMAPEGDPATSRRVLHGMRREVQRLTRLVSDLLTLTRLDAHRPLQAQVVDLAMLAREVVEGMRTLAQHRALVVETEGDTQCRGDADQLKQVFYNLLDNAIHSTDAARGAIVLRIRGAERAIHVAVSDNGLGIPGQAQPHVFERFYRVDKARARASFDQRSGGGSGLGLAIVKAIVEAHGGSIAPVESEAGHGTTMRFTLPRAHSK
jgi:signal transduction histidine kinase